VWYRQKIPDGLFIATLPGALDTVHVFRQDRAVFHSKPIAMFVCHPTPTPMRSTRKQEVQV
jgi:hypothetical protein